jgi:hypothetical protein
VHTFSAPSSARATSSIFSPIRHWKLKAQHACVVQESSAFRAVRSRDLVYFNYWIMSSAVTRAGSGVLADRFDLVVYLSVSSLF